MDDTPSKLETRKDTIQVVVESGTTHVGHIAGIVARAVRDVTRELGEFATDVFEMRAAARRADARREANTEFETVSGGDSVHDPRSGRVEPG